MTLANLGGKAAFSWPWADMKGVGGNAWPYTMDAASEKLAYLGQFPVTGTITDVAFYMATVGATSWTTPMDIRLETVSGTNGAPSGTLYTTNASGTFTPVDVTTENKMVSAQINGGTGVSVTAGDFFYLVFANPASGYGSAQINYSLYMANNNRLVFTNTGAWSKDGNGCGAFAVKIGGTWYAALGGMSTFPFGVSANVFPDSTSNPKKYGAKITMPFKARCSGACVLTDYNGDVAMKVLNSSFSELGSVTLDKDFMQTLGADGYASQWPTRVMFASPFTLDKDSVIYVLSEPTTTTLVRTIYNDFGTSVSNIEEALPGGSAVQYGYLNNSNVWTQQTGRHYWATLFLDQIEDGAAAAGSTVFVSRPSTLLRR